MLSRFHPNSWEVLLKCMIQNWFVKNLHIDRGRRQLHRRVIYAPFRDREKAETGAAATRKWQIYDVLPAVNAEVQSAKMASPKAVQSKGYSMRKSAGSTRVPFRLMLQCK